MKRGQADKHGTTNRFFYSRLVQISELADWHDALRPIDQIAASATVVFDNILERRRYSTAGPALAVEFLEILRPAQFGRARWQPS